MSTTFSQIEQFEMPLPDGLRAPVVRLWERTFDTSYAFFEPVFAGEENGQNRNLVLLVRRDQEVLATCQLTVTRDGGRWGGVGEVAVDEAARKQGLATQLCRAARDWFWSHQGEIVFLGTVNPAAARIYRRLGWHRLPGTTVMAATRAGETPEAFLVDHFRGSSSEVSLRPLNAAARLPVIPLVLVAHPWQVLDANLGLGSIRFIRQDRCMSLYPLYQRLAQVPGGQVTAAWTADGHLVGLASANPLSPRRVRLDGFCHPQFLDCWDELIRSLLGGYLQQGATVCAVVASEDEEKRARFAALGFVTDDGADEIAIAEDRLPAQRLVYAG